MNDDDPDPLAEADRAMRAGLARQLQRAPERDGGEMTAGALAGVLFDVLAEGFKPGTESARQLDESWSAINGINDALTRRTFDYEAFMLGAFGTSVAVDLALTGDGREAVQLAFRDEAGRFWNRFRRQTPGRGRIRWYLDYYGGALGEECHPERTWYVPVARAFTAACREQAVADDAFDTVEPALAAAALNLFVHAVSGTVAAVRGWDIQ